MPSTHPDPLYSRAEIGILACSKCGNPMSLSQIEPAAPGYDVRNFRMREVQFQRALFGRYLTRLAGWNKLARWKFRLYLHFRTLCAASDGRLPFAVGK
jgi:hypothetical protein